MGNDKRRIFSELLNIMIIIIIIIDLLADSTESTIPILKNTREEARETLN